jgi:hypothetical protein
VMFSVTASFLMLIPPLTYLTPQEDRNHRLNWSKRIGVPTRR